MYSKLMNKYFRGGQEPVTEGWGKVASVIIPGLGVMVHGFMSIKAGEKILADPKIQKYIIGRCKEFEKQVKRDGYSADCDMTSFNLSRGQAMASSMKFKNYIFNHLQFFKKVGGKYWVAGMGDTDHIEKMCVFFQRPKDSKFISKVIPAPTNKELNELGYRKEDRFD